MFESRDTQPNSTLCEPSFYCDGKVIAKSTDLKPYIERRRARLAKQKNR